MFLILILMFLFLFSPFGIEGVIFYVEGSYEVILLLWFITPRVSVRLSLGTPTEIPARQEPVYREIYQSIRLLVRKMGLLRRLIDFVSLVNLQLLEIEADIGFFSPAVTGIFVGSIWSALSSLMIYLQAKNWPVDVISLQINPLFDRESVNIFLRCIFTFSLGKIFIGYLLFILKNKGRPDYGRASY